MLLQSHMVVSTSIHETRRRAVGFLGRYGPKLRALSCALALGYIAALLGVWAGLRFLGEQFALTTFALYLPRYGFALPLPLVVVVLGVLGPRSWLFPVALSSVLILLFPLMGLSLGLNRQSERVDTDVSLRVLSYNVAGEPHPAALLGLIREVDPDLLLLQEFRGGVSAALALALPKHFQRQDGQFFVSSRFPLEDVYLPEKLEVPGSVDRSARFVRYRVRTPSTAIDVFNVHPVSPRNGIDEFRGSGFLHSLKHGDFERSAALDAIVANSVLRKLQAEAFTREAARSNVPVIVAGDTNMPALSWIYATTLGTLPLSDGFAEAGKGFGYTFPSHRPWMRIDRILASAPMSFARFEVTGAETSDHLCVWADLRWPRNAFDGAPSSN